MKFLLDTHLLIWAAVDPVRLSEVAARIIESPSNELYFSAASIWEVAIKTGSGGLKLDPSVLRRALIDADYYELAITGEHAARVNIDHLHGGFAANFYAQGGYVVRNMGDGGRVNAV